MEDTVRHDSRPCSSVRTPYIHSYDHSDSRMAAEDCSTFTTFDERNDGANTSHANIQHNIDTGPTQPTDVVGRSSKTMNESESTSMKLERSARPAIPAQRPSTGIAAMRAPRASLARLGLTIRLDSRSASAKFAPRAGFRIRTRSTQSNARNAPQGGAKRTREANPAKMTGVKSPKTARVALCTSTTLRRTPPTGAAACAPTAPRARTPGPCFAKKETKS